MCNSSVSSNVIFNNLSVIQLNVNSIRSIEKKYQLDLFLRKHRPHILLCCETNLNNKNKVNINNYNVHRADRTDKSGGGTAIFISDKIAYEIIEIPKNIKSIECSAIKIKDSDGSKMIFVSVYKPPNNKLNPTDLTSLLKIDNSAKFMIAGDFNSHSALWNSYKTCSNGRELENWYTNFKNHFEIQLYSTTEQTCFRSDECSYIDFAFLSENFEVNNSSFNHLVPTIVSFSDHAAIKYNLKTNKIIAVKKRVIKNFNKTDWIRFNSFIDMKMNELEIPLTSNMDTESIETTAEKIEKIFCEAVDKIVPNMIISTDKINISKQSKALIHKKKITSKKKV